MHMVFELKPYRVVILSLFVFSNILSCLYFIYTGYLGGDLLNEYTVDVELMFVSILYVVSGFAFVMLVLPSIFTKIINGFKCYELTNFLPGIHYLFMFISVFYFVSVFFYNIGLAGGGWLNADIPKSIMYLNAVICPPYLILIYIFSQLNSKSKIYFFNVSLYAITAIVRGFTNPFIYLFVVFLLRKECFGKPVKIKTISLVALVSIFLYPFVRIAKTVILIRNGFAIDGSDNQDVMFILNQVASGYNGFLDLYLAFLFVTFERFQHVANVQFLLANLNEFHFFLSGFNVNAFYGDGWMYHAIGKVVDPTNNWDNTKSIYGIFAQFIRGSDWNAQIGFVGWIVLYPELMLFYILYVVSIVFILYFLSRRICAHGFLVELTWCILLVLVAHGWIMDLELYLQSMILFYCMVTIINYISNPTVKAHGWLKI